MRQRIVRGEEPQVPVVHVFTSLYSHTDTHTQARTHAHTRARAHTHTHTHTYAHAHAHAHKPEGPWRRRRRRRRQMWPRRRALFTDVWQLYELAESVVPHAFTHPRLVRTYEVKPVVHNRPASAWLVVCSIYMLY